MKHPIPMTAFIVVLFFVSQITGLLIVNSYIDVDLSTPDKTVYKALPLNVERPPAQDFQAVGLIIGAVFIGTLLLFVIIHFRKANLWRYWYLLSVGVTLTFAFNAFIKEIFAIVLGVVLAIIKVFKPNPLIHNFTELFIYGGLAAIFVPILNIYAAALLLFLISIYDMVAVWKSKHMVKLAKFQTQANVFAGIFIPYDNKGKPVILEDKPSKGKVGTANSAILGGGDMGFPLIFAGIAMKTVGFVNALIIPILATLFLLGLLLYSQKGKFYPAMPFLSAACFLGYGIAAYIL